MADEEVRVRLIVDGEEATVSLDEFKKNLTGLGGATDKGGAALKGFKFAAKELGHELGLGGGMSRMFGSEVMHLAETAGVAGLAIGGLTLAGIAGYKVYEHFAEETKKHREEMTKAAEASMSFNLELDKDLAVTRLLVDEKRKLNSEERESARAKLEDGIEAQTAIVEGLRKQHLAAWQLRDSLADHSDSGQSLLSALIQGNSSKRQTAVHDVGQKLQDATDLLNKMKLKLKEFKAAANEPEPGGPAHSPFEFQQMHDSMQAEQARTHANVMVQIELDKQQKLTALAQESMNQRWENEVQMEQNKITMLQGTQQVFGQIYEIGGQKMKAFFYLQQGAAASEAFIHYQLAAAKAVGQTGLFGLPMAGYFQAMSYIVPGLIMAKTFMGGREKGVSATPTFSANPSTGLPTGGSGQAPVNLTLVVNGQSRNIGEITADMLRTLYNNNGSMGGLSVAIERTA